MDMDAVGKATEALYKHHTNADLVHWDTRDRVVRAVLDAVGYDALRAERDELRRMVDDYLDHEDTHQAGEEIDTGYGTQTLCTEDEACRLANFWPCPTERLRRARAALDIEEGKSLDSDGS